MFSNKEFEMFDGHFKGQSLMTLDMLIMMMNDKDNAYLRTNRFGSMSTGQDGRIVEGELIAVNDGCYGVFLGNTFNPLIYRGENKEYQEFVPSIDRRNYITGNCDCCVDVIKKMIFLDWFRTTPYYTVCKNIQMNGHNMYFDFEAIAQHYEFPTSYIDISRDINVAMFFAYTYFKDGAYHPIVDFDEYKPCLYIGNLKDIYTKNKELLKLISYQSVVRAYQQKAMALDLTNSNGLKKLFLKVELPNMPEVAMGIYEHFVGGELLMPSGKINNYQDIVAKYADIIRRTKVFSLEYVERYCGIYQKDINDIRFVLEKQGYEITTGFEQFEISKNDLEVMYSDIDNGIKPFLNRLGFRPFGIIV